MKDDKFILVGLDDEDSKHVAEVLKSKTCKKILDYLSDVKEASEKDLADGLKLPINTIEYNLKKLVKSGLVVSKNFFWSVKGKKIPMYRLARKHIIISHKKPSLSFLKSILPVAFIGGLFAVFLRFFSGRFFSSGMRNEVLSDSVNVSNLEMAGAGMAEASKMAGNASQAVVEAGRGVDYAAEGISKSASFLDKIIGLNYVYWFLAGLLLGIIVFYIYRRFRK